MSLPPTFVYRPLTTTVPGDPEEFPVVTYNILNLPQAIDGIDDDHSVIRYLADGTKLSATAYEDGYVYAGPFRFYTNCESEIFESAASAGGRIVNPLAESGGADYKATYFITDHLGSTRAVVDSLGTVLQQNDFLPFGEKCSNNALTSGNNPYLYCGKELHETFFGIPWYDSGARWQTTDGIFASPDPLCEKYYSLSPYAYCAGNPINRVDPDGKKLFFAKGSTEAFKKSFAEAIKIMNEKGTSYNIAKLEASDQKFYIQQSKNNQFDPNNNTIEWNPCAISIRDKTGILRSPLTSLAHEAGHANNYRKALDSETTAQFIENAKPKSDCNYDTIEDRTVITTTEQYAARQHGEITGDQYTRHDHTGHFIGVNKKFESMQDILNFVIKYNESVVILDTQ